MAGQVALVQGSDPLVIPTFKKATKSGGTSKLNQDFKINPFAGTEDEVPNEINGFSTKKTQYYNAKTVFEQQAAVENVRFQKLLVSDYGGDVGAFMNDQEENVMNAQLNMIQQKNALLNMHNEIETEWSEFEESDLFDMAPGTPLFDGIGAQMRVDDIINKGNIEYLYGKNPSNIASLMGVNINDMPAEIKSDPKAAAQYILDQKRPQILNRDNYLWLNEQLPYGQDFNPIDGIDTQVYLDAFHSTMKEYGETEIGTDGDRYIVKTSADQIKTGIEYFHGNIVRNNPELNRIRNAFISNLENEDAMRLLYSDPELNNTNGKNFQKITEALTSYGVEDYDDVLPNLATLREKAVKDGNNDLARLFGDYGAVEDALLYENLINGGNTLSESTRKGIYTNRLKDDEQRILNSYYKVARNRPKDKMRGSVYDALELGNYDGFNRQEKKVVTNDDQRIFVQSALKGEAKPIIAGRAFDNTLDYYKIHGADGKLDAEESKKFFTDPGNNYRINDFIIAKAKGKFIDQFINYAAKNDITFDQFDSSFDYKGVGSKSGYKVLGVQRGQVTNFGGMKMASNTHESQSVSTREAAYTNLKPEQYTARIQFGQKGSTQYNISVKDVMQTEQFKKWADQLSEKDRTELYNVDQYISQYMQDDPENIDLEDYMMYHAEGDKKLKKGRYEIATWDISGLSGKDGLTGDPLIKGLGKFFDPAALKETEMPISAKIVGIVGITRGLNPEDREKEYVMAKVAVHKDEAEKIMFKDAEGEDRPITEIYKFDENSFDYLARSNRDYIHEFFERDLGKYQEGTEGEKDLYADMMVITLPIPVDAQDFWLETANKQDIDTPEAADQNPQSTNNTFPTMHGGSIAESGGNP